MMTDEGRLKLDALRKEDVDPRQLELPWGGRSPRCLTEAHERFILRRDAAPLDEELSDVELDEQSRRDQYGW